MCSCDRSSVPRVEVVDHAARRADHDVHAALAAPAAAARSSGRRRSAARGSRAGARRSSGRPRRPGSPARASAPAPAPAAWSASGRCCARIGSANAAVLPVPVWAWPEHVAALQQRGDGRGLDRRGRFVADRVDGRHDGSEAGRGRRIAGTGRFRRRGSTWALRPLGGRYCAPLAVTAPSSPPGPRCNAFNSPSTGTISSNSTSC